MEQTQNTISDERLAEKLRYAEIAEAAYVKSGLNPEAELWGEDVSLLRELTSLRKEEQRWEERRVHTQDWYARHYGELHKWARLILPEHFRSQFFNCIANGSFEHSGGTGFMLDSAQQQILHDQSNRAEDAEAELEALRASHKRLVELLTPICAVAQNAPRDGCTIVLRFLPKTIKQWETALAEARKLEGK